MMLNTNGKRIIRSGGWAALWDGFTAAFLVAFALALGASNTIVGLIGAAPFAARLLAEIPGAKLLEYFPRLKIFTLSTTISRLSWIGIILIPFLFMKSPLAALLAFFFMSEFFSYLAEPSWIVLLADHIPVKVRGEFWAARQKLFGLFGMVAMLSAGWYLDMFTLPDYTGFVTMFAAGIFFGLMNASEIGRIRDNAIDGHEHHGFREYLHIEGSVKKFMIFVFFFNFAIWLASPFFAAYMLKDLSLSYTSFAVAASITVITKLLVFKHIGKLSDRFGDKPVLLLSVIGTGLVPLAFIFITPSTLWLLWPTQVLSGLVWAGHDVTIFNMFLDVTTPQKRAIETAAFNVVTSVPLIIAPILGGFIADKLVFMLAGIPIVFAISTVLRLASSTLLFGIPETRAKKQYPLSEVFYHALKLHPSRGTENILGAVKKTLRKKGGLFISLLK